MSSKGTSLFLRDTPGKRPSCLHERAFAGQRTAYGFAVSCLPAGSERKDQILETVTGYVEHIVFRNEENGYTVFHLENDDGEVTCVGNFNFINEGEMLELTGEYVNHNVYGTQLKVVSHIVKEPEDLVSIERYLGSGAIKGVGLPLQAGS